MTFPYQLEDPTGPMRTCEQYWQNAADAVLSGSPVGRFDIHIHNIYIQLIVSMCYLHIRLWY